MFLSPKFRPQTSQSRFLRIYYNLEMGFMSVRFWFNQNSIDNNAIWLASETVFSFCAIIFCLCQLIGERSRRKLGEIKRKVLERTFRHGKPNPTPSRYVLIVLNQNEVP